MNCITSYWLLCENALDDISSSVANYLSEKCVMIAHKTYAQNMVLNNGACMIQFHKNVESFFHATNAWCLENHCSTSLIFSKQILYHSC
jgi:hypothetical protein